MSGGAGERGEGGGGSRVLARLSLAPPCLPGSLAPWHMGGSAFKQLPIYINSSLPSQTRKLRNFETTWPCAFHATHAPVSLFPCSPHHRAPGMEAESTSGGSTPPPAVGPWCRRNFISRCPKLQQNQTGLPNHNPKPTPAWLGGGIARSDANPHPGPLPLGR